MKGYIYKYTFPNGKVFIGSTRTTVKQKHYVHMSDAKKEGRGSLCEVALAKFGEIQPETIETIEVETNDPKVLEEQLKIAKVKWIREHNSTDNRYGYNIQNGGERVTADMMILQEKWYEIFAKEHFGEEIAAIQQTLESIGNKMYNTNEELTEEEKYAWNEIIFTAYDEEMSFKQFYDIYRCFEMAGYEGFCDVMLGHAMRQYIDTVREIIWAEVNANKWQIIREYWATAKIQRIPCEKKNKRIVSLRNW